MECLGVGKKLWLYDEREDVLGDVAA